MVLLVAHTHVYIPFSLYTQNIRVLQKNLVYAVGLAGEICDEELLKGSQYFGQFGKIIKA